MRRWGVQTLWQNPDKALLNAIACAKDTQHTSAGSTLTELDNVMHKLLHATIFEVMNGPLEIIFVVFLSVLLQNVC